MNHGCAAYREEQMLLGIRRRLLEEPLTDDERKCLAEEARRLEEELQMD